MVANIFGITLESLEVEVTGDVDVRGTLAINAEVPVARVETAFDMTAGGPDAAGCLQVASGRNA